ncbi:hypothetical protein NARC_150056 [Candidatus Nitrosocosmicus arcticus]|uniref:Uncharacterized protein n=1 Tax=Candidatus Nitrosocosmicus arcticus TaxID=2035267 RepID=A0A557SSA0_9ARCH|nr:hypothetical protein NARC_150056 [Candidatus Nitrosocosmicus arcticus]
MVDRSEIITKRKMAYQLMKLAKLVRKKSVRKYVIMKWILAILERLDQLWR